MRCLRLCLLLSVCFQLSCISFCLPEHARFFRPTAEFSVTQPHSLSLPQPALPLSASCLTLFCLLVSYSAFLRTLSLPWHTELCLSARFRLSAVSNLVSHSNSLSTFSLPQRSLSYAALIVLRRTLSASLYITSVSTLLSWVSVCSLGDPLVGSVCTCLAWLLDGEDFWG